jgi:hypothetical protein
LRKRLRTLNSLQVDQIVQKLKDNGHEIQWLQHNSEAPALRCGRRVYLEHTQGLSCVFIRRQKGLNGKFGDGNICSGPENSGRAEKREHPGLGMKA